MNQPLLTRLAIVGLFVLAVLYTVLNFKDWEVGGQIISLVVLGVGGGIVFVIYVLPMIGELIGGSVYSGVEELRLDPSMKAAAKVSAGDYEGAVAEYLKLAAASPGDAFPVIEAAKVALEKLNDPARAAEILSGALAGVEESGQPMESDSHAGLHFRLAEIYVERMNDHGSALELMRVVGERFPDTRHAVNAGHRIQEWEEASFLKGQGG